MAIEKSPADAAATEASQDFALTLDEFCLRQSAARVGPELLGGFHQAQVAAGRTKATEASYSAELVRFQNQPA